jgi:site-specific DNA-methyltransferase (adenine-specific)
MRVETIGAATMYLGDCREIVSTLADIACVVTSPPYNQLESLSTRTMTGLWGDKSGGAGFVDAWVENGYADKVPEAEYQEQQRDLFSLIAAACLPDASLFYNHQLRWRDGVCLHPIQWFTPANWSLRSEVIWDRAGGMMFNARMFVRFDERILWFVRGREGWKWNQEHVGLGTIWRIPRAQNKDHPVAYPVELPTRCILATTSPGDIVLDPYSGSASTGVAAVTNGRRYIGIEREEKYFDAACRRIEDAQRQGDMFIQGAAA